MWSICVQRLWKYQVLRCNNGSMWVPPTMKYRYEILVLLQIKTVNDRPDIVSWPVYRLTWASYSRLPDRSTGVSSVVRGGAEWPTPLCRYLRLRPSFLLPFPSPSARWRTSSLTPDPPQPVPSSRPTSEMTFTSKESPRPRAEIPV